MKISIISILLAASISFGAPVPKADLDKVNAYIAKLGAGESTQIAITSAEENDSLITAVSASIRDTKNEGNVGDFSVDLNKQTVKLELAGAASPVTIEDEYLELAKGILEELVKKIEAEKLYSVTLRLEKSPDSLSVLLKLTPLTGAETIKYLEFNASYANQKVQISLKGDFFAKSELVTDAQTSLTKVFQSLKEEREPTDEDFKGLTTILETVLAYLSKD